MKTAATAVPVTPSRVADLVVLTKIRLNALVVATTAGGYYMGARDHMDLLTMLVTCTGTALVASGAAAFNQVWERDLDALMERTRHRPLAEGRMRPAEGHSIAAAMSAAGLLLLWVGANAVAALIALATLLCYLFFYTPLKRKTSLATVVGAVPGALPPLIGWAAAQGSVSIAACSLFLLMFVWQLPHFLAIAWMYREDYARAGLPMLTVVDTDGRMTGLQASLWAATLVPISLLPAIVGLTGAVYAVSALILGLGLTMLALAFLRARTRTNARWLFLGSITYLPLLWLLMAFNRT